MCILLLCWTYSTDEEFQWLEYFAGEANLTSVMASAMYTCGKFDILYNEQPEHRKSNYMDLTHASGYGLALLCILRCRVGDFAAHLGLKCSSLCKTNRGTSQRSACASVGFWEYPSVYTANVLIERSCTMVALVTALGGLWSLEQPSGSVLEYYPTWRHLMAKIFENGGVHSVTTVRWWMGHYNAPTPKRHWGASNSPLIRKIDKGVLQGWKKSLLRLQWSSTGIPKAVRSTREQRICVKRRSIR